MPSKPLSIHGRTPSESTVSSLAASSTNNRRASTARLVSPIPPGSQSGTPAVQQVPNAGSLAALDGPSSSSGPSQSVLAAALAQSRGTSPRFGTPPKLAGSPTSAGLGPYDRLRSNYGSFERLNKGLYGSFDTRDAVGSSAPSEVPEIIKRHLVQPDDGIGRGGSPLRPGMHEIGQGMSSEEFSSLRLQGGDITRPIYRWTEENEGSGRNKRSRSFNISRPEPESEVLDISNIKVPGGFRRDFLRRAAGSPASSSRASYDGAQDGNGPPRPKGLRPQLLTNNFLEFLSLYGHFAGEELEEDDEVLEPDEYFADAWDDHVDYDDQGGDREPGEDRTLLTPGTPGLRRRKHKERGGSGTTSPMGAALLLVKSFVGTGVLFLPRAFLNGGMLFSSLVLIAVAVLSYHCFILLVKCRLKIEGSFGDIGGKLYGKYMRALILASIVLSQVGFVGAYIVFTSENLQAFIAAVSKCSTFIDIKFMVLMQLIIFLPLSLIRDIGKLGFTALVADFFIMLGLIYLYYYDITTIVAQKGVSDVTSFNPSTWTLFIGTAIFTFEGVGLIIPIQESMRRPEKFPRVLAIVMVVITILFTSAGALSYAAYGSETRTVILLNLPQDDKFVNVVQFLYSLAILLSTPLQLFPAIRIMENELFSRSGKYNPYIKWKKNVFRFFLVAVCALIAWGGADDLDKFVALVGCFACVPLVYIYPPLLHLKAVAQSRWHRISDYALFCFGLVGCAYTTVLTIQQWAGSSGAKPPGYCDV